MKANMPWASPDASHRGREPSYPDTGCSLHPACLTCSFERCRYDEPDARSGHRTTPEALRGQQIVELRAEGLLIREIAERMGVRRRTVFRALAIGDG